MMKATSSAPARTILSGAIERYDAHERHDESQIDHQRMAVIDGDGRDDDDYPKYTQGQPGDQVAAARAFAVAERALWSMWAGTGDAQPPSGWPSLLRLWIRRRRKHANLQCVR